MRCIGRGRRLVALAAVAAVMVGVLPGSASAIYGDDDSVQIASPGDFPFAASVSIAKSDGTTGFCTGTLVDRDYVLTAAHCVEEEKREYVGPGKVSVTVGRTDLSDTSQGVTRNVDDVLVHPRYRTMSRAKADHDIALLQLAKSVTSVTPVELASPFAPNDRASWKPGTFGIAFGWGRTPGDPSPDTLRFVRLKIHSDDHGNDRLAARKYKGVVHINAGGDRGTCRGDSGGPLLIETAAGLKQVGVSSWGRLKEVRECWKKDRRPAVYAEVAGLRMHRWVRTVISRTSLVGDFDGDGRDDLASFTHGPDKDVEVARSGGVSVAGFGTPQRWHSNFAGNGNIVRAGDFDGDGRDDIWSFSSSGSVWVTVSEDTDGDGRGDRFAEGSYHRTLSKAGPDTYPLVGDIDGDGDDDLVLVRRTTNVSLQRQWSQTLRIYRNVDLLDLGDAFEGPGIGRPRTPGPGRRLLFAGERHPYVELPKYLSEGCTIYEGTPMLGDATGDGSEDLVVFTQNNCSGGDPGVYVARATGFNFAEARLWQDFFALRGEMPGVGFFGGRDQSQVRPPNSNCTDGPCERDPGRLDRFADIVTFTRNREGDVYVGTARPHALWFEADRVLPDFSHSPNRHLVGDFNGDGADDFVRIVRDGSDDVFVSLNSGGGSFGTPQKWHGSFPT